MGSRHRKGSYNNTPARTIPVPGGGFSKMSTVDITND